MAAASSLRELEITKRSWIVGRRRWKVSRRGLILELFDTERDRQLRREMDLVAQQRVSRRIIRQLAHEVKNPLGGLRGAAQLLERQLPTADLQAYTKVIIDEADRLASLVDGILQAGGQPKKTEF